MSNNDLIANKNDVVPLKHLGPLYSDISEYIRSGRSNTVRLINSQIVSTYWLIGKRIFEEEQHGANRAEYGSELLKNLSAQLMTEFGKGFSLPNLKNFRQFYVIYKDKIGYEPRSQSFEVNFNAKLSWTHYRILMRISNESERDFYESETSRSNWSTPELQRQIETRLYDRLTHAKSEKDRSEVRILSEKGTLFQTPEQIIRDPYIWEFLNIPESKKLSETDLESTIITHLQEFLLEMGRGFAFIGRQYRLTIDGEHYRCDLVFYHAVLKCYFIVDIKTTGLTHADWGQMHLYVKYFDKEITTTGDNPTIGLILCTDKKEALVKYLMDDEKNQVFASKYQFHLPTEEQLRTLIRKEQALLENQE